MSKLFPIFASILVCACASTAPARKEPVRASQQLQQEFKQAKASADSGDSKRAIARLKKLVEQEPASDLNDDAHLLMGNLLFSQQRYADALVNFRAIFLAETASPLEVEAILRATRSQLKLGQPAEAEKTIALLEKRDELPEAQAIEAEQARFEVYSAAQKPLPALLSLVRLSRLHPTPSERERYRTQAHELLDSRLNESELALVGDDNAYGFLQAPAKYRYALLLAERRNFSKARSSLVDVVELASGGELAERASSLIRQIDARSRVEGKTIGVVLPLSGKQAAIGYRALKGIQLGLGIYGRVPSNFRLAVIDSEGNPDVARRAVERLVTEDNVIAIVGGLLSKTVSAEAGKAQELGVPAIMLSAKSGITQIGDYVFRNAITSDMQIDRLVEVAMSNFGMKNFAIMYPNDAYGVEFANLFWDEVASRGGNVTAAQPYDPKETDFRAPVMRLGSLFYTEDRSEEYRTRLASYNAKNPKRSARQSPPTLEEILPPVIDFDGIFIPDSARAVGLIAPMLAFSNITNVRLLGTNIWNSQTLVSRAQKSVENSIFVDAVLTSDRAFQGSQFYGDFKALFAEEPGQMELQAYDSALLLRQAIAAGESTRVGLQQRLASVQNFPGAIGALSVNAGREFRRPLSTLTIKDGKIGLVDNLTAK